VIKVSNVFPDLPGPCSTLRSLLWVLRRHGREKLRGNAPRISAETLTSSLTMLMKKGMEVLSRLRKL
jgi:hypothetical protein